MKKLVFLSFFMLLASPAFSQGITFPVGEAHLIATDPISLSGYPFSFVGHVRPSVTNVAGALAVISDPANGGRIWGVRVRTSGDWSIVAYDTTFRENAGGSFSSGEDHTFVGVFASSTDRRLYIDGVLTASGSVASTYHTNSDTINVGRFGDITPSSYFQGTIYEILFIPREVTQDEAIRYHRSRTHNYSMQLGHDVDTKHWIFNIYNPGEITTGFPSPNYQEILPLRGGIKLEAVSDSGNESESLRGGFGGGFSQ